MKTFQVVLIDEDKDEVKSEVFAYDLAHAEAQIYQSWPEARILTIKRK